MKAYVIDYPGFPEKVVVWARTAGKAKIRAMKEYRDAERIFSGRISFKGLSAKRRPDLDHCEVDEIVSLYDAIQPRFGM